MWSRADQIHVATDDIDELRQLIESKSAQPRSDPGDAVEIVLSPFRDRVLNRLHGSEFDEMEGSRSPSQPCLAEQDWTTGIQFDGQRNEGQERCKHQQSDQRNAEAQRSLRGFQDPALSESLGGNQLAWCDGLDGQFSAEALVGVRDVFNDDSVQLEFE